MAYAITKENLQLVLNNYFTKMNNKYDPQLTNLNARSIIGNELKNSYSLMATNQTPVVGEFVQFNTSLDKGITVTNGVFTVQKGTTYRLACSICTASATVAGYITFSFYNITKGQIISTSQISESVNLNSYTSGDNNLEVTYEATDNDMIGVRIDAVNGAVNISSPYSYLIVEEKGRTFIVDPMDVKNEYIVEYGSFYQTTPITNTGSNTIIPLLSNNINNIIQIDNNYYISLKADSIYSFNISFRLYDTAANYGIIGITDTNENIIFSEDYQCQASQWDYSSFSFTYKATSDIKICLKLISASATIDSISNCSIVIQKIAQPVVVEYNKYNEVSNPLTTENISQENPIGSIINYSGTTIPTHFLLCDGSILNIADYPELAQHFIDSYGKSNYYGGDGITTFAVPNLNDMEVLKTDVTPNMTSATAPSPYIVTYSSQYNTTYAAWKAFNKSTADIWSSSTSTGDITLDFANKTGVSIFRITSRNDESLGPTTAPKDFSLQGSDDGITFTTIQSFTGETGWGAAETRTYKLDAVANYRYYRLNVTANNGYTYVQIAEITFLIQTFVYCIKSEPTHYAVNQYGGFEKTVLFDGNANAAGNYSLEDNIENYDFLLVEGNVSNTNTSELNTYGTINIIPVSSVVYNHMHQFMYNSSTADATIRLTYSFLSNQILRIDSTTFTGVTSVQVTKVTAIKGQLPTLLTGGEF